MNFVEVCAGGGGLGLGFVMEGFEPLLFNEIDANCCETLRRNHPEYSDRIAMCDMSSLDLSGMEFDILMGGIPCQPFSHAGKRLGFGDSRGGLFHAFASILGRSRPKFFLVENVKGLVTHDRGRTLRSVLGLLENGGDYRVKYKVVDSSDHEVPQRRQRVIIVGVRSDIDFEYKFPAASSRRVVLGDVLVDVPPSNSPSYSESRRMVLDLVPQGGNWKNLPRDVKESYMGAAIRSGGGKTGFARRLSMESFSPTLTTSPSQKATEACHPLETRPLTVREYARIQTFPDSYEFAGGVADQYRQIGNAVPVNMARHLARSFRCD